MVETRPITIDIPEFASMSDDEVTDHILARVLDGRWSPLTRELLARFGTDKLDLNESWANTWQRWECPSCLRRKAEIARLSADRVLLCKIDLHHDHLVDLAKQMFRETADDSLSDEIRRMRTRARAAAFGLIERFTRTLLCEDCNHADGDMKAALAPEIAPDFSFSPAEIARFIKPNPNVPHEIAVKIGRQIWEEVRPAFEDRVTFTRILVARIQEGRQDIEVGPHPFGLQRTEASMLYDLALRSASRRSLLGTMFEGLLNRSRATDGNRSNASKPSKRRLVVPTAEEFAAVDLRNAESKPWVRTGADWRCEICERTKFEICRKSNKGRWAAAVQYLCSFTDETDPENQVLRAQEHAGEILLRSHRRYAVCQDCRHVVTEAVKAVPGTDEYCFRPEDLRALVGTPVAHSMHAVTIEAIKDAVWANTEWIDATRDYWAHRNEALNIYSSVSILMTRGQAAREAKRLVFDDYLARQQGDEIGYGRPVWLLREGARFAEEDKQSPWL
jgi:hypothetical protein